MTTVVELSDVTVARGGRAVWSEGSFAIDAGSIVAVLGPNGSGKSTLFDVLLGRLPVATGEVRVFGAAPVRGEARIGYVPQHFTASVADAVRCVDLVTLGLTGPRWGMGRLDASGRARVAEVLDDVGAGAFATRRVSELSGGQQQRVAIAHALVHEPELLLLDEPFANLDVGAQHEIAELLATIRRRRPVTILVITHDLNPMLGALDGIVYLLDGHPHYGPVHADGSADAELVAHLYGARPQVVHTAQGDLFARGDRRAIGESS